MSRVRPYARQPVPRSRPRWRAAIRDTLGSALPVRHNIEGIGQRPDAYQEVA